jgi:RimJ/RimL family protein N-acetyltransferase
MTGLAAWGKDYATEGVRALVEGAFDSLSFDKFYSATMAVNLASRRVLEKNGF